MTIVPVNDDIADGDQYFAILTDPLITADVALSGHDPDDIFVTNIDFPPPSLGDVSPKVSPALGGIGVTVTGANFDPNATIWVGEVLTPANDTTWVSATEIRIIAPPQNQSDFDVGVTVRHPVCGSDTLANIMYFTDNCPFEGMFGLGTECVSCPECGVCPGGYRIYPEPGCWNEGINSGFVWPCAPPERCLGGVNSTCAPGYAGRLCAECEDGYYLSDLYCVLCEDGFESFPFAILIVFFVILACVVLVAFFGSSRSVHAVAFFLFTLQVRIVLVNWLLDLDG